jgi:hypothetical protein
VLVLSIFVRPSCFAIMVLSCLVEVPKYSTVGLERASSVRFRLLVAVFSLLCGCCSRSSLFVLATCPLCPCLTRALRFSAVDCCRSASRLPLAFA